MGEQLDRALLRMNSEKDALRQEMVSKDKQLAAIAEKTEEAKKSQQTGFEFRIKGLFKLAEDEMLLNQVHLHTFAHTCTHLHILAHTCIYAECNELLNPVQTGDNKF
jgi:hypothetical protein